MKFSDFVAFEKHLRDAYPHHFAPVYALIVPHDDERRAIADSIVMRILKAHPHMRCVRTDAIEVVDAECESQSLFGDLPVIVFDPALKGVKLPQVPEGIHLILGCPKVVSEITSDMIVLDLSKEKPWDREKRLGQQLIQKASAEGKQLERPALDYLLQAIGPEWGLLTSELDKLICFVGERSKIDLPAARSLVRPSKHQNNWQLAEKCIWERQFPSRVEAGDFPMLVGALRYQLELGYVIATDPENVSTRFPKVRPHTLANLKNYRLPASYFKKGLVALYEAEKRFKNGISNAMLCLEIFMGHINDGKGG